MKFNVYCYKKRPERYQTDRSAQGPEFTMKQAHEHMQRCEHGHELVPVELVPVR